MLHIWQAAVEQFDQNRNFVLATILSVKGSSPRHVGTRFLLRDDGGTVGTIGGGLFEARVQRFAETVLETRASYRSVFSFTGKDSTSTEMICGGEAEVLLEFVDSADKVREDIFRRVLGMVGSRGSGLLYSQVAIPLNGKSAEGVRHLLIDTQGTRTGGFPGEDGAFAATPEQRLLRPIQILDLSGSEHPVLLEWLHPAGTVYLFGAGHVGVSVALLAAYVHFQVVVLDDRTGLASRERFPNADRVVVLDSFENALSGLGIDSDCYIVIVTRGHSHDRTVLAQALRTPAAYIGMIGSRRKNNLIFQALLMEGFTREDLQRVHAPIGLPIGGETPEEIGVSIVAEMIQARNAKARLGNVQAGPAARTPAHSQAIPCEPPDSPETI
ncbi:MAG: XdhC family protein [Desulfomonile tiedjei]|nr:XdhC family protein [Desulfomonile tiedjei]